MSLGHAYGIEAAAIHIVLRLNANLEGRVPLWHHNHTPAQSSPATLTALEALNSKKGY
jgi:hypothetical protein